MFRYRIVSFASALLVFLLNVNGLVFAQSLAGVAYRVLLDKSQEVPTGTLISLVEGKYRVASIETLDSLIGVINLNPQIEIDTVGDPSALPLVKNGLAYVRVTNSNGQVKAGSILSLSQDLPGIAALASKAQMTVLGQAMETFEGNGEGLIKVDISIQSKPGMLSSDGMKVTDVVRESFFELFKVFQNASQVPAPQAFKFVLSGLILISAILFGFFTFGRVAQRGVEAIGRNPLARNTILVGLVINVAISISVIFSGLIAAYYIIRL